MPMYQQVANVLRAGIIDADKGETTRLPTERDLCDIHRVSRITIRKAMDLLEQEGLIQRAPSRGTLTVPVAIRRWKRLRQNRVIHVLTAWRQLADIPATFYGQIYQGVLHRSEEAGYQSSTLKLPVHRTELARNLHLPNADTTLGVVLIGLEHESMIQLYTDAGFSVVVIDYWTTNPQADAIVADCFAEGQTAAEFLVRQGHSSLFYIGNRLSYVPTPRDESDAELLLAGFQRAIKLAGLQPLPQKRIRFFGPEQVAEAVRWFVSLSPRPTAGLIFNDGFAGNFIDQLRVHGVRCPEDVSIIAKGSVEVPDGLSCLRTDAYRQGEMAVDCLLDRAAGRRSNALHIALPSRLERGRTVRYLGSAARQANPATTKEKP